MGDFGCGDGAWTTVMKIDGRKVLTQPARFCQILVCRDLRSFENGDVFSLKATEEYQKILPDDLIGVRSKKQAVTSS